MGKLSHKSGNSLSTLALWKPRLIIKFSTHLYSYCPCEFCFGPSLPFYPLPGDLSIPTMVLRVPISLPIGSDLFHELPAHSSNCLLVISPLELPIWMSEPKLFSLDKPDPLLGFLNLGNGSNQIPPARIRKLFTLPISYSSITQDNRLYLLTSSQTSNLPHLSTPRALTFPEIVFFPSFKHFKMLKTLHGFPLPLV